MSKFKQRKYLERYAEGGLVRAMKNRQKIQDAAEKKALVPMAAAPAPMAPAPSAQPAVDGQLPVGPVNEEVAQQAMQVKKDAEMATRSLGLRGFANGDVVEGSGWSETTDPTAKAYLAARLKEANAAAGRTDTENMITNAVRKIGRFPGGPVARVAPAAGLATARGLAGMEVAPHPLMVGLSAMSQSKDAGAARSPITDYTAADASRRQLATQYPDQVSRAEVRGPTPALMPPGMVSGRIRNGDPSALDPTAAPFSVGQNFTGLRGYANGGDLNSPGYGVQPYQSGGDPAFRNSQRRDSSIPISSYPAPVPAWHGAPRLERIPGGASGLADMVPQNKITPYTPMPFSSASPNSPASGAAPVVAGAAGVTRTGSSYTNTPTPAPAPSSTTASTTTPAPAPAGEVAGVVTPVPAPAAAPVQRADWAKGLDLHNAAAMPTVGESMGNNSWAKVATNPKTGYPMMANGGQIWGGPETDNESTRVHSTIYKGPGGKWDGMPMFANGGSIPNGLRGGFIDPSLIASGGSSAVAKAGEIGSRALHLAGRTRLAMPGYTPLVKDVALPTFSKFLPAASGIAGAAQSLTETPLQRAAFDQSVGATTPLQSAGANGLRVMRNVGDAFTGGVASQIGQAVANRFDYADGGAIKQWNPGMGVHIPKGGSAVMTNRQTGQRITLQRGLADGGGVGGSASAPARGHIVGRRHGMKALLADGGQVNRANVDDGMIFGDGGPTEDKQPIMASPGEFIIPADSTDAIGRNKLRKLVAATHTPVHLNQGLRSGYADGEDILQRGTDAWRAFRQRAANLYRATSDGLRNAAGTPSGPGGPTAQPAAGAPNQPSTYERFFDPATGEMKTLNNQPWAGSSVKPDAYAPLDSTQRPIRPSYEPRPGFQEALNERPLTPPSPQRALDIEQLATRGSNRVTGVMNDLTKMQRLGRFGNEIMGSKIVQGAKELAEPAALAETARETWNTPTEDYRKRFALDEKNPEGTPLGLRWMAKPGLGSDVAVRTLGAASDLGNVLVKGATLGFGSTNPLFRDKEAKAAAPPPPPPPGTPGLGFSHDPGPKDASQRENQGIPIPARTGLRQGEELPPVDAQGRPINATEMEPIPGGGYISGVSPVTGQQRLVKYTKDSMPLPMGATDTTSPEILAADKARRADWTAQSQAIDDKNARENAAEGLRLQASTEQGQLAQSRYDRSQAIQNKNPRAFMNAMRTEDEINKAREFRGLQGAQQATMANEMAKAKMQAEATRYAGELGLRGHQITAEATLAGQELTRDVTLAQLRHTMGKENLTDLQNMVDQKSQVFAPGQKGGPSVLDPGASAVRKAALNRFMVQPTADDLKILRSIEPNATSLTDVPKERWGSVLDKALTAIDLGTATGGQGMPASYSLHQRGLRDTVGGPDYNSRVPFWSTLGNTFVPAALQQPEVNLTARTQVPGQLPTDTVLADLIEKDRPQAELVIHNLLQSKDPKEQAYAQAIAKRLGIQ